MYLDVTPAAALQFATMVDPRVKVWQNFWDVQLAIILGRRTLPWEREVHQATIEKSEPLATSPSMSAERPHTSASIRSGDDSPGSPV